MKKVFFIPLVLCFISSAGGDGFFEKGPFFWKAEKDGRVLHILGTVHVGVDFEDLKCSEEISQSLAQANLVWTESNQSMQQTAMQNAQTKKFTLASSGDSFRNLNKESKDFFHEMLKISGGSSDSLKSLSYTDLLLLVDQLCTIKHKKFIDNREQLKNKKAKSRLDAQIQKMAEDKEISQNYLDTLQNIENIILLMSSLQTSIVKGGSSFFKEEIEEKIKNCTQENLEKNLEAREQPQAKIIENTLSGQDFDILELNVQYLKEQGLTENQIKKIIEVLSKDLLKRRNENWLKKIVSAHQEEESMFIAAGLAHFTEDYNVLDMLKGEGFTIKRYSAGCAAEESY